jgi:hypothetical protein
MNWKETQLTGRLVFNETENTTMRNELTDSEIRALVAEESGRMRDKVQDALAENARLRRAVEGPTVAERIGEMREYCATMSEGAQVFVGPSKLQETGGEARKEELREAAKRASQRATPVPFGVPKKRAKLRI